MGRSPSWFRHSLICSVWHLAHLTALCGYLCPLFLEGTSPTRWARGPFPICPNALSPQGAKFNLGPTPTRILEIHFSSHYENVPVPRHVPRECVMWQGGGGGRKSSSEK